MPSSNGHRPDLDLDWALLGDRAADIGSLRKALRQNRSYGYPPLGLGAGDSATSSNLEEFLGRYVSASGQRVFQQPIEVVVHD